MKREADAKFSKIESTYAIRDDFKILSQRINERLEHCFSDSGKLVKITQNENQTEIENIKKGLETKVTTDELEMALTQQAEIITDDLYATKIKSEVDQQLHGMDSQISKVKTEIVEVRKKILLNWIAKIELVISFCTTLLSQMQQTEMRESFLINF